ncbi:MAG: hypothetical protein QOJ46_2616 [bacterium]|jgi:hypothetical protein
MTLRTRAARPAIGIALIAALCTALAAGAGSAADDSPQRKPPQAKTSCQPPDGLRAGYCGDGGPAGAAKLSAPRDVSAFPDGDLLIADGQNLVVRRVKAATGVIITAAGLGILGFDPPRRPTSVVDVALVDPRGVAALPDGSFAIADAGLRAVLLVTPDGMVRTLLNARRVTLPVDVAALDDRRLVVVDKANGRIVKVDVRTGRTRTLVRGLDRPQQVAVDATGGLIISLRRSRGRPEKVVRRAPNGVRTVVAGPGAPGVAGTRAFDLDRVTGVFARADGTLLVADHHAVRAVSTTGEVTDVAGGGPPSAANVYLGQGEGITQWRDEILIADSGTDQVHRVAADGSAPTTEIGLGPAAEAGASRSGAMAYSASAAAPAPPLVELIGKKKKHKRRPQTEGGVRCDPNGMSALWHAKSFKRGKLIVAFGGKGQFVQVTMYRPPHGRERQIDRRPATGAFQKYKISVNVSFRGWRARVRWQGHCNDSGPFHR